MLETVLLMAALAALGVGATWVVFAGLIYYMEVMDD
jgi:hypothetical protein